MNSCLIYSSRRFMKLMIFSGALVLTCMTQAAVTDLANQPLANGLHNNSTVKPNIAFVVDDSNSMEWESMPADDDVTGRYGSTHQRNNRCFGWHGYNTVFYNPAVTYKPPYKINGALYSDRVTRYPDADFAAALKDGYFPSGGVTFHGTSTTGANTATDLSSLNNLSPNEVSCTVHAGSSATLTITGNKSTSVSNITVNGTSIWSGNPTESSNDTGTVATRIANRINALGYSASSSGNVVTINAPYGASVSSLIPVVTKTGNMTITASAFGAEVQNECSASPSKYYYTVHKTNANSTACEADNNYRLITDSSQIDAPNVATGSAAAKTNYANWYSYYRTRAGLMKASVGEAFKDLDESKYRAGIFFINGTAASPVNTDLAIADFSGSAVGTQRFNWYSKLYSNRGAGGTPLRTALARVGRMYAGKISDMDPVQYSCQQNFTILSTDGYWNDAATPKRIDGTTEIGHVDREATSVVPAKATISIGDQVGNQNARNGCYTFTSIQVNTGAGATVELLNSTQVPATCTTKKDELGQAVASSIQSKTSTGFTATYNNGVITITAPSSLGGLTTTPTIAAAPSAQGTKTITFTVSGFSGYVAASEGTVPPFKDALGIENTLADVAYYYYTTDLRDTNNGNCTNPAGSNNPTYSGLCENNVKGSGNDNVTHQHMTTYTVGLGVSGNITYQSDYAKANDIDGKNTYYDIVNNGLNWPNPFSTDAGKIDDLWHAAVNGRGVYYSASEATSLKRGIQSALSDIRAEQGSSAAAATSNLEPVEGDNFVYVARYRTVKWDGDLVSYTIDPNDGKLSLSSEWSAQARLNAAVTAAGAGADGRTIKYFNAAEIGKLKDFNLTNLTADSLDVNFSNICSKMPAIDQCGGDADDLNADQITIANSADNLIKYLRGQSTHEDEASNAIANRVYRGREFVLGDIVNAAPVYMKKPPFNYGTYDATYNTFKTDNANREATVFVAANDGMLHAIDATNGNERWAFIPTFVIPNLWNLADRNYANNHRYFVDGSPTLADICSDLDNTDPQKCERASDWKTILVGGLNKGGCGYYALDVTNPTNPKGLWEFTHDNLGYSYGNPLVVKRKDGKWVVIFSSGHNNYPNNGCGNTGDGNGHVFIVDAYTGALLDTITTYTSGATPAGTTATPSGLTKLNAWVENVSLPIADRLYGGDVLGNVWRIDFDNNYAPSGKEAVLLAQLKDGTNAQKAQPITTKPELAAYTVGGSTHSIVLVGTGRYLGTGDRTDRSQQTIYALKDELGATGISDVRGTGMKARTMTQTTGSEGSIYAGRTIRKITGDPITWSTDKGWYLDLNPGDKSPGERVNVDMSVQYNMLTAAANVPADNACAPDGYGFLYFLDVFTGKNISGSVDGMAGVQLPGNALVAGNKTVKLTNGKLINICTDTAGNLCTEPTPDVGGGTSGGVRRTTWREIPD